MDNNVVDINEYLRRKQLLDSLGSGGMSGYSQLPQTNASGGDTVPPGKIEHPYLDKYRQSVEAIPSPDDVRYKPSGLRKGLGVAAGVLGGILKPGSLEDRIKSGEDITGNIEHQPYNKAAEPYVNTANKYKALSDIEGSLNTVESKQRENAYKDLLTQAQTENQKSETGLHNVEAAGKPGSYAEDVAGKIKERKASLAAELGKTYEATLTNGENVRLIEDPESKILYKSDPTKENGRGDIVDWGAIEPGQISFPNRPLKELSDTPFKLWQQENKSKLKSGELSAEDWVKKQSVATQNEYNDFKHGILAKHSNMSTDEVATRYSQMKGENSGVPIVFSPGAGGTLMPKRATPGTPLPPGTETGGGINAEAKDIRDVVIARRTAHQAYQTASNLVNDSTTHPENAATNDYALLLQFIGATKPEGLAKMRLNNNEIALVDGTRSLLGDLTALGQKLGSGAKLIPTQRQSMLNTLKTLSMSDEEINNSIIPDYVRDPKTNKLVLKKAE